ncbi:UDP-3-O-(3-hydroxymyristoyl)glucosamine N-acyltransferase [Brevundimonas halotolerans]|uniref:UDP-3-O-[3-hydroxymyristoyl] glucosamine N-acyltransferase n=1 Tax=Brevundimonas halotolerans TaxID=69670 RepID=A0A7W9E7W8_9CAUL|nr:UDP-3-O-(3-hydroxymyristoyl)glucosamine N-acyltransferase [Brevundimonas halotolerans]MBB5661416.1 UDP-3-O-[3-hydroxymyristoyl] glucosamine N-acyltransferase [Brevundimonas halotolerans]
MSLTAGLLAAALGDLVTKIDGDPDRRIVRASGLGSAAPGHLLFLKPTANVSTALPPAARDELTILCAPEHVAELRGERLTLLMTDNPRLSFLRALNAHFTGMGPDAGVHPSAVVHPDAQVDATASVGALCYVGPNCRVGARSVLHPNVTLVQNVKIDEDVVINSGTVVGADGFGYERNEAGELEKFPHLGGVHIESGVEIGSNTSIDRGTLDDTVIRQGARIDNQVHISHNVQIGRHSAVIAQSMVGGSASVGEGGWLAPAAIVMNQIRVGAGATVGMAAVVVKDVPDGMTVMGSPAVSSEQFRTERAKLKSLLNG